MIIINRSGHIEIGNEIAKFKDGDIIYIPQKTSHSLPNDVNEMVEFLTFGGFTDMKKGVGGG
jgi:mannose-6-phosphate isomerase-like protein (cupin superfamily)